MALMMAACTESRGSQSHGPGSGTYSQIQHYKLLTRDHHTKCIAAVAGTQKMDGSPVSSQAHGLCIGGGSEEEG